MTELLHESGGIMPVILGATVVNIGGDARASALARAFPKSAGTEGRIETMDSAWDIACAPNFRDMGGWSVADGGHVRHGQLFRSEAICMPGVEDARRLEALGIRLVCDLRSGRERETAVSHWARAGAEVLEMDIVADIRATADPLAAMRDDPTPAAVERLMIATNRALPAACAEHLDRLFGRLADGDHPVVIHCTAGKDRTGFFSAMILHALGVAEDDIMADYLASGERRNPAVVAATRAIMEEGLGIAVDEAVLEALAGVRPDYLAASLGAAREAHDSIDAYLADAAGLTPERRAAMERALVV